MKKKLLIGIIAGVVVVAAIVGGVFLQPEKHKHTIIVDPGVPATCTSDGVSDGKHCSECGVILEYQASTPKISHEAGTWVIDKEATKNENGLRHAECTMCGIEMNQEIIYATGSEGLEYKLNSDNQSCTIIGIGDCTDSHVVIPCFIDGYKVTAIGDKAFYNCMSITEITVPITVSEVGTYVFYKAGNLHTVYYNGTYGSKDNKFLNLSNINKVVLGGEEIPADLLYECNKIKEIEIKSPIKRIPKDAFSGCTMLTTITIPESVTFFEYDAFENCTAIRDVYYGGDIEGWMKINYSVSTAHPLWHGANLYFDGVLVTEITIPDSVTAVGWDFKGCRSLEIVNFHDFVTHIGSSAFEGCTSLRYITIPEFVTSIGDDAFKDCTSLESVNFHDFVTYIGSSAFEGCTSLRYITIPESVTSIGKEAFKDCKSLCSIQIPSGITTIHDGTFANCTSLTGVWIPSTVTSIGEASYPYCGTFENCTALNIFFDGTVKQWQNVKKVGCFKNTYDYLIVCTDGYITKSGNVSYR